MRPSRLIPGPPEANDAKAGDRVMAHAVHVAHATAVCAQNAFTASIHRALASGLVSMRITVIVAVFAVITAITVIGRVVVIISIRVTACHGPMIGASVLRTKHLQKHRDALVHMWWPAVVARLALVIVNVIVIVIVIGRASVLILLTVVIAVVIAVVAITVDYATAAPRDSVPHICVRRGITTTVIAVLTMTSSAMLSISRIISISTRTAG